MEISILHIDDDPQLLEKAAAVLNDHVIGENVLQVKDSCGFEEGLQKLAEKHYDLVILDLCIGAASEASDKIGEDIFKQIKERAFIPVVFFTGLPDYVRDLRSDIVKVAGKAEGYDSLFTEIETLLSSGLIQLKEEITSNIREGLRTYFWDFVHPNVGIIDGLKDDPVSLKYILLRRLAKSFASELTRVTNQDPEFQTNHSHPMEFYIYPDIEGEYETGDLVKDKNTGDYYVILTPSCDLVQRKSGSRNAESILLIRAKDFKTIPEYQKMIELQEKSAALAKDGKALLKEEAGQLAKLPERIKEWIKPGSRSERYFFLPKTPFIPALLIDFQTKLSVSYEELETIYTPVASLDNPISQAVQTCYTRYYSRIGYHDLDIDYAYSQIIAD